MRVVGHIGLEVNRLRWRRRGNPDRTGERRPSPSVVPLTMSGLRSCSPFIVAASSSQLDERLEIREYVRTSSLAYQDRFLDRPHKREGGGRKKKKKKGGSSDVQRSNIWRRLGVHESLYFTPNLPVAILRVMRCTSPAPSLRCKSAASRPRPWRNVKTNRARRDWFLVGAQIHSVLLFKCR